MSEDSEKNRLSAIITRGGDKGSTSLGGGQRVPKDSLRLESYGTIDELNSFVGMVRGVNDLSEELLAPLKQIQSDLFTLGGELCFEDADIEKYGIKKIDHTLVDRLEEWAAEKNELLPPLKEFVLPAGPHGAAELHVCRTVCRRAERVAVTLMREREINDNIVKYLNRLSDLFFIWSRWVLVNAGYDQPEYWDRTR